MKSDHTNSQLPGGKGLPPSNADLHPQDSDGAAPLPEPVFIVAHRPRKRGRSKTPLTTEGIPSGRAGATNGRRQSLDAAVPFPNRRAKKLSDIGELAAILRITRSLGTRPDVVVGAGDDCAVVRCGDRRNDLLLKSDSVVQGVHFTQSAKPRDVGHKALGRVLSDIAAMGGVPCWALVNLVAPASTPVAVIDGLYAGMRSLAAKHNLAIVGGDMSAGETLELHVFGVGTVPRGKAILRSGAKPDDMIFVTGRLGGSLLGKHLKFSPRMAEGAWLRDWASSMIDISDGLATDLRHICEASGVGARIMPELIPISRAAHRMKDDFTAYDHAVCDGEDFELLFTVPVSRLGTFGRSWNAKRFPVTCFPIGLITPRRGSLEFVGSRKDITKTGYQHFA